MYEFTVNKTGWKRERDKDIDCIVYYSTHRLVESRQVGGTFVPEWKIIKQQKGYMLHYFNGYIYERVIGFMHHKRLYDVQYYCDVEVEKFRADYR